MHNCRFSSLTLFFALASIVDREREREEKKTLLYFSSYSSHFFPPLVAFFKCITSKSGFWRGRSGEEEKALCAITLLLLLHPFLLFPSHRRQNGRRGNCSRGGTVACNWPALSTKFLLLLFNSLYSKTRERNLFIYSLIPSSSSSSFIPSLPSSGERVSYLSAGD